MAMSSVGAGVLLCVLFHRIPPSFSRSAHRLLTGRNYFGDPFEPDALKKRRAYKKWAEMLLHPELKTPTFGSPINK
jgi:hypothetical protein